MANRKTTTYRFGAFELDPLARVLKHDGVAVELTAGAFDCLVYLVENRERPVGKDELIATVWGSADVSENLLAQAIVRLRRALGDSADEQRCIKTLPRVGYRWIMETVAVCGDTGFTGDGGDGAPHDAGAPFPSITPRRTPSGRWVAPLVLSLVLAIAVAGYGLWRVHGRASSNFTQGTVAVMPAQVHAPDEWSWLRLGLMDLVVGDLRGARIPVESSDTVLHLLDQPGNDRSEPWSAYALRIRPQVAWTDNRWHVQLDATAADGHALHAEAIAGDMLEAAHAANASLLAQMGATEIASTEADRVKEQYLLRMDAASYAGTMAVLRGLIDNAPGEVRQSPEFAYAKADFYCEQDQYEACKKALADLLQRVPTGTQPTLRGRALALQWYVYAREHKYLEGAAALEDAITLLRKQSNTGYLAYAYAQRAELLFSAGRLQEAAADFGLARVNYALAGDTAGALGIDESLAVLSMQHGRFAEAIPVVQRAYDQYHRMGMKQYLPPLLIDLAISRKMLLQHADALATTDQYWPLDEKFPEYTAKVDRHILMFQRADALAGVGRTAEASQLLKDVLARIDRDPHGEPGLEGTVYTLLARLAMQRGETAQAQAWIAKALSGSLLAWDGDKHDYADAWLANVQIAQQAKDGSAVDRAVEAMQNWTRQQADQDDWLALQLLRAQAIQAGVAGHADEALTKWKLAKGKADQLGVPELIVDTGLAYTLALLENGKTAEASALSGELSAWAPLDWRVAWAQACLYRIQGRMEAWETYRRKAQELAGDRVLVGPRASP